MADVNNSASSDSSKEDLKTPVKMNLSKIAQVATPGIRSSSRLRKLKESNVESLSEVDIVAMDDDADILRKVKDMKLTKTSSKSKRNVATEAAKTNDIKDIFTYDEEGPEPLKTQNCRSPSRKMKATRLRTPSVTRQAATTIMKFQDEILNSNYLNIFSDEMNNENTTPSRTSKRAATSTRTPSVSRRQAAAKKFQDDDTKILDEFCEILNSNSSDIFTGEINKENATSSRSIKAAATRTPSVSRRTATKKRQDDDTTKSDDNIVKLNLPVTSKNATPSRSTKAAAVTPARTPSVTDGLFSRPTVTPKRQAAAAAREAKVESFKDEVANKPPSLKLNDAMEECKELLFNNMIEYLEEKILKYFQVMTEIQKEVYNEYSADENFKFYQFTNMNVQIKVCNLLATKWARTDIKKLYKKTVEFYMNKVFPASSTFSKESKIKVAEYGRILTGIAFVNGDYYLGLTCAFTVLELLPLDSYMFVLVSKWSCQLREFDIFDKYDNSKLKYDNEIEVIRNVCRLYSQFFKTIDTEKQFKIVDEIIVIKNELQSKKQKSFVGYFAINIINNLLGHAAKLPMYNVEKYGDMIKHFTDENYYALSIAVGRLSKYRDVYGKPPFIYEFDKIPDSQVFLKNTMSISDYHDSQITLAKVLLQNGCVHDCEKYLIPILYSGTLLAAPFRVLQPLNAYYYLKFRTINDKDKVKGFGAMIALLLGKLSDLKDAIEPYSRFRTDLLNDTYTFQAKSNTESVLNKTLVTVVTSIPEHSSLCECFLCYQLSTNENLYAERQYSDLLIDGLSIEACSDFYSKIVGSGFAKYKRGKAQLYEIVFNKDNEAIIKKQKCAPYSLLTYICEATTQCILQNKNIGKVSNDKFCQNIIKCSAYYPLELRYYYLLGRQFKRKTYSLDAYSWITGKQIILSSNDDNELDQMFDSFDAFGIAKNNKQERNVSRPKSPTREALANQANVYRSQGKKGIGLSGMTEEERNDFNQARIDFKVYQHLLFSEWRRRICHYLGSYLAEEYPWYSAWYFHEARAICLRQHVRLRKSQNFEDLRFKDIAEFKTAVRALPNDFTLIQLIVDDQNVLWLCRCGYDIQPIVIPLTKLRVGKDAISHRMYKILLELDQSCGSNVGKTVLRSHAWTIFEQLNAKLKLLISDLECEWLNKFRVLLMPFGKLDGSIDAAKKVLKKVGFSEERGNFLAKLFIHAYPEEYKHLLSIFSFIERETFKNPINSALQESIYQKLLTTCPKTSFEKYLKQDRYTVLILSPELSCYPWESLSIFNSNPFVLRIQSFHFFDRSTKNMKAPLPLKAKSQDSYYVLNPGGDLIKAEKRIAEQINLHKLDGMKNQFPTKEKFIEVLEKNNFYFYIGHGNGGQYVNTASIRQAICKAVVILMGCSSVRIEDEGHGFDGRSAVNDYTIAGAPCTIGCLWKVMSREIDKFLIDFVERCFAEWSSTYSNEKIVRKSKDEIEVEFPFRLLIKAMVQARQACSLKTLTGGAVVAYGIPVFNDESTLLSCDEDAEDSVIILD